MEGIKGGEEKHYPKPKPNPSPSPKRKGSSFKICICRYCGRRFLNAQALGGHQNAHKKERKEAKDYRKEISSMKMISLKPSSVGLGHGVSRSFHPQAVFNTYWPGGYFPDHMHRGAQSSSHHVPATTTTTTTTTTIIDARLQGSDFTHKNNYNFQYSQLPDLNFDPPLSSP